MGGPGLGVEELAGVVGLEPEVGVPAGGVAEELALGAPLVDVVVPEAVLARAVRADARRDRDARARHDDDVRARADHLREPVDAAQRAARQLPRGRAQRGAQRREQRGDRRLVRVVRAAALAVPAAALGRRLVLIRAVSCLCLGVLFCCFGCSGVGCFWCISCRLVSGRWCWAGAHAADGLGREEKKTVEGVCVAVGDTGLVG